MKVTKNHDVFFKLLQQIGAVCIAFTLVALQPFPVSANEKITIGLVPEMNVFAQMQRFQPLADYLHKETGIEIKLRMLNRYGNILGRLRSHDIDAAFLGSLTAALAINQLHVVPIARPLNLDRTSTYHGHIFVRKNSKIEKVEDMRGKTMAFVDRATTAGYVFPLAWLRENGIDDHTTFFRENFFAGSHDAAIDAVISGKADIGAAKNTIYDLYLENNPQARDDLMIIASSSPVPSNGLCVMPTTGKETIAKLETALLALDRNAEGRKVLEKLRAIRFVKTTIADYEPVFSMAEKAGIDLNIPGEKVK